jgi:hypothetical protein
MLFQAVEEEVVLALPLALPLALALALALTLLYHWHWQQYLLHHRLLLNKGQRCKIGCGKLVRKSES